MCHWLAWRTLLLSWAGVFAIFWAVDNWTHPLTVLGALLLLPGRQLALAVITHECGHGTFFSSRTLNRIAGQVQGIARMVAEDRYCMDILTQIQAVKAALAKAEGEILRDHAAHCVTEAIAAGDAPATKQKLDELIELFNRSRR